MSKQILVTEFAPAERVSIAVVHRQQAAIAKASLPQMPDLAGDLAFILNSHRQIVYASEKARKLLENKSLESVIGLRPGEALDCLHAHDHEGGCGTSIDCRQCNLVKAILTSLQGQASTLECHLTRVINFKPVALDLLVCARPFQHEGERYAVISIQERLSRNQQAK